MTLRGRSIIDPTARSRAITPSRTMLMMFATWSLATVVQAEPGHGTCTTDTCDNGKCEGSPPACVCDPGFTGMFCETAESDVCVDGVACVKGLCTYSSIDEKNVCVCPPGFEGALCGTPVDACKENPCLNGGTCTATTSVPFFQCTCPGKLPVHLTRYPHVPKVDFVLQPSGRKCGSVCVYTRDELFVAVNHLGISEVLIANDIKFAKQPDDENGRRPPTHISIGEAHRFDANKLGPDMSERTDLLVRSATPSDACANGPNTEVKMSLDASATDSRIFMVDHPHRIEFRNLHFRGGERNALASEGGIALIKPFSKEVSFLNCDFDDGNAELGGAVLTRSHSTYFDGCTFTNNKADAGGALFVLDNAAALVENSEFSRNVAKGVSSDLYCGGAINNMGTTHVMSTTFRENMCTGDKYGKGTSVVNMGVFSIRNSEMTQDILLGQQSKTNMGFYSEGQDFVSKSVMGSERRYSVPYKGYGSDINTLYTDCDTQWGDGVYPARVSKGECGPTGEALECTDYECFKDEQCTNGPACVTCFPGTVISRSGTECVDCVGGLSLGLDGSLTCKSCELHVPQCGGCRMDMTEVGRDTPAECTQCAADSVSDGNGECRPCADGEFAAVGFAECQKCPPGYKRCTGEVVSDGPGGGVPITPGVGLPGGPGTVYNELGVLCDRNYYLTTNGTCEACTDGTFGFGGKTSQCTSCDDRQCGICNFTHCETCKEAFDLGDDGTCGALPILPPEEAEVVENNAVLYITTIGGAVLVVIIASAVIWCVCCRRSDKFDPDDPTLELPKKAVSVQALSTKALGHDGDDISIGSIGSDDHDQEENENSNVEGDRAEITAETHL